jgi:hypothetical protein
LISSGVPTNVVLEHRQQSVDRLGVGGQRLDPSRQVLDPVGDRSPFTFDILDDRGVLPCT